MHIAVVVRAAVAAGSLVGGSFVACSGTTAEPDPALPSTAGSSSSGASGQAGMGGVGGVGGMGGTSGMSGGGSAGASAGGTGGTAAGSAGAGGGSGCVGNQIKDMQTGMCTCPPFAPTFCSTEMKCFPSMKDPDHCGDCMTKCAMTSACSEGECTTEPASIGEVAGCGSLLLQQQGGKLYLLSTMTGSLKTMAIPAGGAITDVATGLTGATAFALDTTNAFVAAGNAIQRVALASGMKTAVVTEATPIHDLAVAGTKLFYVSGKAVKSVDAAANGGTGTQVVEPESMGEPKGVAVGGTSVLFASSVAFNVEVANQAGGGLKKIGASQGGLIFGHRSVQADDTNVFWAVDTTVRRSPFGAGDPAVSTIGNALNNVSAYAINATHSYFASYSTDKMAGDLEKQPIGMEKATWMARGLPKVTSLVVDATSVYLATEQCKILKTAL